MSVQALATRRSTRTRDGLIQDLDIENDAAVVVQLGAERRINAIVSACSRTRKKRFIEPKHLAPAVVHLFVLT